MPRIKRWFHVSHDINSDGEVWELTDKFGVAGLRLWLELLSIADRNEGGLPSLSESTVRQLSIKCNTTQTRVRLVLDWCLTRTWVVCDPSPIVRNWRIYNPLREDKKSQTVSPPILPNHPNLPKEKIKIKSAYPSDWQITESLREWVLKQHVGEPEVHKEAFRDYHVAKGSRFTDWDAAFRTWIRNASKFAGNGRGTTAPPPQPEGQLSERTMRILRRGL